MAEIVSFTKPSRVGLPSLSPASMYRSELATKIVNNSIALYAQTRRNFGTFISLFESDSASNEIVFTVLAQQSATPLRFDCSGLFTGATGKIRVWLYMQTASANAVKCEGSVVPGLGSGVSGDLQTTSYAWKSFDIRLTNAQAIDLERQSQLSLMFYGATTDLQVKIKAISVYEPNDSANTVFHDTTAAGCVLGDEDQPISTAALRAIEQNYRTCLGHRTARANILNTYFDSRSQTVGATFSAYWYRTIVPKGQGITSIRVVIYSQSEVGTGDCEWRVTLKTTAGGLVSYDDQSVNYTSTGIGGGSASIHSFTGLSAAATEYEVLIQARQTGTTTVTSAKTGWVIATQVPLDVSTDFIPLGLPSKLSTQHNDDVLFYSLARVRDLLEHVWSQTSQVLFTSWPLSFSVGNNPTASDYYVGYLQGDAADFPMYLSEGTRAVVIRGQYNMRPLNSRRILDFSARSGSLTVGEVVSFGTSGATAIVKDQDTSNNNIEISELAGSPQHGETGTGATSGNTITVSGVVKSAELRTEVRGYFSAVDVAAQNVRELVNKQLPEIESFRLAFKTDGVDANRSTSPYYSGLAIATISAEAGDGRSLYEYGIKQVSCYEQAPTWL